MATFYFNGAVDGEWTELGNWWMDDTSTTQATSLPTSADDVIASASIASNSGSAPTVANLLFADPDGLPDEFNISITVTGNATFNNYAVQSGNITVAGNATFNDTSINNGTVTGSVTFNNSAFNGVTVTGDATFNDTSFNFTGSVSGDATFNEDSYNASDGAVTGNATFNDRSSNNYGTVSGNATFNGTAQNTGTVVGDATFNDAYNEIDGVVEGNATFNGVAYNAAGASVYGTGTFNGSAYDEGLCGNGVYNDSSYFSTYTSSANLIFNDNAFMNMNSFTSGAVVFRGRSYNKNGTVGFVTVELDSGINGSSILGVV